MALGSMESAGPRDLRTYLRQPGPDIDPATVEEVDAIINDLLSTNPNHELRLRFSHLLRGWDNEKNASWTAVTPRNTAARRSRIHELLKCDQSLQERIEVLLPRYTLEEPVVIASEHKEWYKPSRGVNDYYWQTYEKLLRERRHWHEDGLLNLENSTRAIVECLANPSAADTYASRGLVMGYVQSGKTANFIGVAARAADAGYRLIIILAGTWNILRNQTQRRFDKDLLGKELLKNDQLYCDTPPVDWNEFLEHGVDPVDLGHYSWQRLTRPDIDFRRLKVAIDNLEFERTNKAFPLYHPTNLQSLPVKLLVVKKHSGILDGLVKDLKLLSTRLKDLPTLIIDDESDHAGINTADNRAAGAATVERSKTNLRIVELLEQFPRGQYVGYTATPYANALIDPDDPKDLFPKDFIVSLDRPRGYMGVADFFDPTTNYQDLDPTDFTLPEMAFIRRVTTDPDEDDADLQRALRSYVLAGAIKLWRNANDPVRYKPEDCAHHTMLVHTSPKTSAHATLAGRLAALWDKCAFNGPTGRDDLESLWQDDYRCVAVAQGSEATPRTFTDLVPYLSESIKRIERGGKVVLVLNSSETADVPDFSAAPIWKIFVGGNKLSRGYTIEGLTISYYRRVAGTADTLMQMGRWFGFRPGYKDLVRVYLGVCEGAKRTGDLVALFKDVCLMEERFRDEISRYIKRPGAKRITPKEIPPLIAVTGRLRPVAKNKMFNARLEKKNWGGQRSMLTLCAQGEDTESNIAALTGLLASAPRVETLTLGGLTDKKKKVTAKSVTAVVRNDALVAFLKAYHWEESEYPFPKRPADTTLQVEFLEREAHDIGHWIMFAPQRKESFGKELILKGFGTWAVKERGKEEGSFQVFGEPDHRVIAEYFAALPPRRPGNAMLTAANTDTTGFKGKPYGVCLIYPVRARQSDSISIGFELFFPENGLPYDIGFTVRKKSKEDEVVVESA